MVIHSSQGKANNEPQLCASRKQKQASPSRLSAENNLRVYVKVCPAC